MYFVLTSLYCLLAFLPYTFCALIKAPPYAWMPWFAHHQALLYWLSAAAVLAAASTGNWHSRNWSFVGGVSGLVVAGAYLTLHPFLPGLESNYASYRWSLAALVGMIALTLWGQAGKARARRERAQPQVTLFSYCVGLLVAAVVSLIYFGGAHLGVYHESGAVNIHPADVELALWSLVSHVVLAIAVVSALNLIRLIAWRLPRPSAAERILTGAAIVIALWIALARFLNSAMSFDGWRAQLYAASLALTVTLWGFSLVLPFLAVSTTAASRVASDLSVKQKVAIWSGMVILTALALASRSLIGGEDWNGFVESTWALVFWIAMSLCLYRLRSDSAKYSVASVLAILLVSGFFYRGLQATEIFWGKPLGSTDDEISLKFEEYEARDASFQLAHHVLGNGHDQRCGELCRILREYTNIRDTHISSGVRLVDNFTPVHGEKPNVFILVIDSMRPDYLGVYNPQVNYTPNLDALARDSIVFKNVYTDYAGTSLSEPAIWAGALLLHAHFPQPFAEVNSLYTLARNDGYRTVVSYDTVLRQLFAPSDDLVKIDADKSMWNNYEACSTVQQLESSLDARSNKSQPVLFYAQPMNVHQFARNEVPSPSSQHWQGPTGLNPRISYEVHWVDSCVGQFIGYLKQHGMYEHSIIVVTSDHGDATGEFGRFSHSTAIWPEVMHVPLIMHVPARLRQHLFYDETRLATLTDITPTLYYLLGHRPIRENPLYGKPLFSESKQELEKYRHDDLFLASDVRAVYGILTADRRYLYVTYDSPAQSHLFDLTLDPNAQHNIVNAALKKHYDEEIIDHLHQIADYYGYRPGIGSLLASAGH